MLLWFAFGAFVLVAAVFNSPALDYRLVMLGAVLPLAELLAGGPWALHTLLGPLVVLTVVMLATRRRRLQRRRWLGLSIGLLLYLVLDGAWLRTELFWWPALGTSVPAGELPEWKPLPVLVALELAGLLVGVWAVRRYGLTNRRRLWLFCSQGRLDRTAMTAPPRRRPGRRTK